MKIIQIVPEMIKQSKNRIVGTLYGCET